MRFASATAVRPDGPRRWTAEIVAGWDIVGNANGGYLLAIVGRALLEATGRPDPVTVTAHYLAPGRSGPAAVEVDVVKDGARFTTATAALFGGDRRLVQVLGTFGDLRSTDGPERVEAAPPELPRREACVRVVPDEPFPPPFMGQVELLLHPDDAGLATGQPHGRLRVRGWFRLADGEPSSTLALLLACDAFPPTAFNGRLPVAWTPTIELTTHVRARPTSDWLRCEFTSRFVTGGFLEEDGVLWDEGGRLVAQLRQLALVPRA